MESRREIVEKNFRSGYNCAQAVVLAFADQFDIPTEDLMKICHPFGGGMGRLRQVCGAVSGMFFVAGQLLGSADPKDLEAKKETYEAVQRLAAEFEAHNGSIVCAQLLGLEEKKSCVSPEYATGATPEPRSEEYYKKRPCVELVKDACDIIEKILLEKQS